MSLNHILRGMCLVPLAALVAVALAPAAEPEPEVASYGQVRDLLARHTKLVELTDGHGARVAICPEYQGRVMTSTCDGLQGRSFGWLNRAFIEAGKTSPQFNNYGGEDRFWLAPEAGQFGLFFAPGAEQALANWFTPPGLNEGAFQLVSQDNAPFYRLSRRLQIENASKTRFDLAVTRDVRLLSVYHFGELFGEAAAAALGEGKLKMVGFETRNILANRGRPMKAETGLVSIWILGMFRPGEQTVVVVPYRPGEEKDLGPVVNADYFGKLPPGRLKVTPEAILFLGDGKFRAKLGTSQRRARHVAGSIDFANRVLTLVHFSMPNNPAAHRYVNNLWSLPQKEPFKGDVFNSYNDGPAEPGAESLGGFYELESLSPAVELARGKSLTHYRRTFHVQGELPALAKLAKETLGVDLDEVRKFLER